MKSCFHSSSSGSVSPTIPEVHLQLFLSLTTSVSGTGWLFERFIQLGKHVKIAINISITGAFG